jgi:hypothetical protein
MNLTGWPFAVQLDGDLEQGAPATITVDCAAPLSEEAFHLQRYVIESFVGLAAVGGLGGDRVPPARSSASLVGARMGGAGSTRVVWDLSAIAIDARALIVLFDMLAFLLKNVTFVDVLGAGTTAAAPFSVDDLPPAWPRVPFAEEDDRTSRHVSLLVEFAAPLGPPELELAQETLQSWLDCGSIQGYRDWSELPDRSFLAPTEHPAFQHDAEELSAQLEDSGVLEGCYAILVNALIKLNDSVPVARLELL